MAHQLDFHVTLWSDDEPALLGLERALKQFEELDKGIGGDNAYKRLHSLASFIRALAYRDAFITQVDVHSIDINWDDAYEQSIVDDFIAHEESKL